MCFLMPGCCPHLKFGIWKELGAEKMPFFENSCGMGQISSCSALNKIKKKRGFLKFALSDVTTLLLKANKLVMGTGINEWWCWYGIVLWNQFYGVIYYVAPPQETGRPVFCALLQDRWAECFCNVLCSWWVDMEVLYVKLWTSYRIHLPGSNSAVPWKKAGLVCLWEK